MPPQTFYVRHGKRCLDIILSAAALVILSPLFLVLTILIRTKLGSPVLFRQKRPGLNERIFTLYKFRSMSDEKDEHGNLLPDEVRLTSFGAKLRDTSLDELPELWNIAKGDMAILGPRPLLVEYLPYYTEREKHRHDVRPGLSGLAQVHGRNALSWEEKFNWDLQYVDHITFAGDVKLLFETVYKTVKRSNILVGKQHRVGRLDVERAGQIQK